MVTRQTRIDDKSDGPLASKCKLGWTSLLAGGEKKNSKYSLNFCCTYMRDTTDVNAELNDLVKSHYDIEIMLVRPPPDDAFSKEEKRAMAILKATVKKSNDRFECGLLWKYDEIKLPPSRDMAEKRMRCLEARLRKNPELKKSVDAQLEDHLKKGYVRKLADEELSKPPERVWYLPLLLVQNPKKPNKIRPVYDAAAKVGNISLNSVLLTGPDVVPSLFGIILRFREGKFAATGDIREMFHQIKIREQDQHCQRFVKLNENGNIDTYVLQVVSSGASCSPATTQYVKNMNADQFKNEYPEAVEVIKLNHYVDDMLTSKNNEDELISIVQTVKMIHQQRGFEIRNFVSNSKKFHQAMQAINEENPSLSMNLSKEPEKVLGLYWLPDQDEFTFSLKYNKGMQEVLQGLEMPTKREMLRILASIFDPMLAPYTNYLRVLMQDLWRSGLDWDDQILEAHIERWQIWLSALLEVEKLRIPRFYLSPNSL